jgi:hypothetical protein
VTTPDRLPTWVLDLVAGLAQYDTNHPKLHAQYAGSFDWQAADCPCELLDLVPDGVRMFAAGWAAARVQAQQLADTAPPGEGTL